MVYEDPIGKPMGKCENHRKTRGKPWENGGLPSGNQTWLAGKSAVNGGFNGKITDKLHKFKPLFMFKE